MRDQLHRRNPSILDFVAASSGEWRNKPGRCGDDAIELRNPDDEVTLSGPLDVNLTVFAEHAMERAGKTLLADHQQVMSHNVFIPADRKSVV